MREIRGVRRYDGAGHRDGTSCRRGVRTKQEKGGMHVSKRPSEVARSKGTRKEWSVGMLWLVLATDISVHKCECKDPETDGLDTERLASSSHIRRAGYDDGRLVRLNELELRRAVVTLHKCVLRRVKTLNHVPVNLLYVDEETVDQDCIRAVAENRSN